MEYYTLGGFLSGLMIFRMIGWFFRIIKRFVLGGINIGIDLIKSTASLVKNRG